MSPKHLVVYYGLLFLASLTRNFCVTHLTNTMNYKMLLRLFKALFLIPLAVGLLVGGSLANREWRTPLCAARLTPTLPLRFTESGDLVDLARSPNGDLCPVPPANDMVPAPTACVCELTETQSPQTLHRPVPSYEEIYETPQTKEKITTVLPWHPRGNKRELLN